MQIIRNDETIFPKVILKNSLWHKMIFFIYLPKVVNVVLKYLALTKLHIKLHVLFLLMQLKAAESSPKVEIRYNIGVLYNSRF